MEGNIMFCTNCGSQFEDGNAFCPNCGTKVESVAQPVAEPVPVAAPVAAAVAPAPVAGGAVNVEAPMPGTILDVKVAAGQAVKAGQLLFILEAMKMENEIFASVDGTIGTIAVTKGQAVETGTVLCNIV